MGGGRRGQEGWAGAGEVGGVGGGRRGQEGWAGTVRQQKSGRVGRTGEVRREGFLIRSSSSDSSDLFPLNARQEGERPPSPSTPPPSP